jgi:hypothetical protein
MAAQKEGVGLCLYRGCMTGGGSLTHVPENKLCVALAAGGTLLVTPST